MSKKQKRMLFRVLASAVLFAVALLLPTEGWLRLFTFLIPYAVIAWDVLWRAVRNIAHGQVFDENFLMSLATVGALATGEYPEAVFVMLFYQVGELFQSYAVDQSRKSITSLMDIRPDYANIEVDGQLRQVEPEDVAVGDTIVIKAGERIPWTAWCWRAPLTWTLRPSPASPSPGGPARRRCDLRLCQPVRPAAGSGHQGL